MNSSSISGLPANPQQASIRASHPMSSDVPSSLVILTPMTLFSSSLYRSVTNEFVRISISAFSAALHNEPINSLPVLFGVPCILMTE